MGVEAGLEMELGSFYRVMCKITKAVNTERWEIRPVQSNIKGYKKVTGRPLSKEAEPVSLLSPPPSMNGTLNVKNKREQAGKKGGKK